MNDPQKRTEQNERDKTNEKETMGFILTRKNELERTKEKKPSRKNKRKLYNTNGKG